MILEMDAGNTRCKWRLRHGGASMGAGVVELDRNALHALDMGGAIERVVVGSVTSVSIEALLTSWAYEQFNVKAEFVTVSAECAGVKNGYQHPEKLGVDRWLAILAAYNRYGASVVIDAGSALTIDAVTGKGRHLGGWIIPGQHLMLDALRQRTSRVCFSDDRVAVTAPAFGCNTDEAVGGGIQSALLGAAMIGLAEAERELGCDFVVVITGGDGPQLYGQVAKLWRNVQSEPDLVLDGLSLALPCVQ